MQRAPGLALAAALHLLLLWLVMQPMSRPQLPPDVRVWLTPIYPSVPVQPELTPGQAKNPRPTSRRAPLPLPTVAAPAPATPALTAAPLAADEPAPAAQGDTAEVQALLAEPTRSACPTLPPDLARLALQSAGDIDRQLRAQQPQARSGPLSMPNARLAQGIAAAHAAVRPKWFEQAKTELISAPNDPNRIYRVTTALGEYCLYYVDKSSIAANAHAKSGWAGFGQPRMAGCPTPF